MLSKIDLNFNVRLLDANKSIYFALYMIYVPESNPCMSSLVHIVSARNGWVGPIFRMELDLPNRNLELASLRTVYF
jgi:hypothetical protein